MEKRKQSKLPRGLRNHNPLNIISVASNGWQGQCGTDGRFCIFESNMWGYRAAFKLMNSYNRKWVLDVGGIIQRWAPPSDGNHTELYIERVCLLTGFEPKKQILVRVPNHRDAAILLVAAMTCVENGIQMKDVDMASIVRGYELAFHTETQVTKVVNYPNGVKG